MKNQYDFSKGRRGPVDSPKGKTRITIHLDDAVIERFRELSEQTGKGYQTLINDALRGLIDAKDATLTADAVRSIVREELAQFDTARR